ncbi:hypothetical protein ACUUL3_13845 [Thiovibrio sp. JS02]
MNRISENRHHEYLRNYRYTGRKVGSHHPNHNRLETLDSVEVDRTFREALKR